MAAEFQLPGMDLLVFVTIGRYDRIIPVQASREIHAGLHGSGLVSFENSGHGPQN